METATDQILKLPLDSAFDGDDTLDHPDNDNNNNSHANDTIDNIIQSQSGDGTSSIVNTANTTTIFSNARDSGTINKPSETTNNGLTSIQNSWIKQFNEPLPTNKEERIQQALNFMKTDSIDTSTNNDNSTTNKNKKHSIRQIALFFQVPKSTLYDRLRNKVMPTADNNTPASNIINSTKTIHRIEKPAHLRITNTNRSHIQQMKLSPEREENLLYEIRNLSHSLGNTMNTTQMRSVILSSIHGVPLGKKWVHNFIKRNINSIIYGSLITNNSNLAITVANSKNSKNNFEFLWNCFLPLIHDIFSESFDNRPIIYITRTCFHEPSMSSLFTCFEIYPETRTIKLISTPKAIIFPDYYGKSYSRLIGTNDIESDNEVDIRNSIKPQRTFKITKLNELFSQIYTDCCSKFKSDNNENDPLVLFEGFQDNYNWDPLICEKMVNVNKFLSVPWNKIIFQDLILSQLQNILNNVAQKVSTTATQLSSMQLDLDQIKLKFEPLQEKLSSIINNNQHITQDTNIELNIPNDDNTTVDIVENNDTLNEFVNENPQQSHHDDIHNDLTTTKLTEDQFISTTTSANIFEDATLSQLQDVITVIDRNESMIYRQLHDEHSKETLKDIFNRIKNIIPQ